MFIRTTTHLSTRPPTCAPAAARAPVRRDEMRSCRSSLPGTSAIVHIQHGGPGRPSRGARQIPSPRCRNLGPNTGADGATSRGASAWPNVSVVSSPGQVGMDTLAEWLRRRPAKPMGSPRVGSNPTGVDVSWARGARLCDMESNRCRCVMGECSALCRTQVQLALRVATSARHARQVALRRTG
jgi:hypothetical protein